MKNNSETNSLTKRLPDKVCSIDIEKWNNVVKLLDISDVVYQRNGHKNFKECDNNGKVIRASNWFFRSLYGNDAHKSTVKTFDGKFLHLCWFYPEHLIGIRKSIAKYGNIVGKTKKEMERSLHTFSRQKFLMVTNSSSTLGTQLQLYLK